MSPELDKKLCETYPKIFRDRRGDKMVTAMCWGFECGDGWYNIIDRLCSLLQNNTDNNQAPQVIATQVKEKFGSLRFYVYGADSLADGAIDMAESLSAVTCEVCGKPGGIDNNANWLKCACPEHTGDKP